MDAHSSNEESQFIDIESLCAESQINKKPKKPSNVRFASETTSIKSANFSNDGEDFSESEPMSEKEIKTEICSFLPSNTLGRRRLKSLSKYQAAKAFTLPHPSSGGDKAIPLNRLRHRSFIAPHKTNVLASLGRHSTVKQFSFEDVQDATDDFKNILTEEERKKELSNIRNIPIRLSQRKIYRY
ncbi:uncharacterized protein CEXT_760631 [Caerostris extrusa]|uniref:Uncharacterized protein n=1 Tax=Caerostris extrusa TaxID=172846 RepID=A0AAV4UIT0_CAEEX|nr:uncharacterized protein CEXT_760631 [Caerostris extrusa]